MRQRVKLRIRCGRRSDLVPLLALALLIVTGLGYLAWGQGEVAASGSPAPLASSAGMRQYYLTTTNYTGGNADGTDVCAEGYHFASLWEIADPSNLKYNNALGQNHADSGQGPPSGRTGWVRTGYFSSTSDTAGIGNCATWTSSDMADYGTTIQFSSNWETGQDIHVFTAVAPNCNFPLQVWCVED